MDFRFVTNYTCSFGHYGSFHFSSSIILFHHDGSYYLFPLL